MAFVTDEAGSWILKHPASKLPYIVDLSAWLGADTLVSAVFTAAAGIDLLGQGTNAVDKTAWVKLGGGVAGKSYPVICHVVSGTGDEEDFKFTVKVVLP